MSVVKLYQLYIGLVEGHAKYKDAFYVKPCAKKMGFERSPSCGHKHFEFNFAGFV